MRKIVYAATPFRLAHRTDHICDFIESQNCIPLHPFNALPLERYNYDRYSKKEIYKICFKLVDISDELWIFGLGSGSLKEWQRAKERGKHRRVALAYFDLQWKEYAKKEKYKRLYGEALTEVLSGRFR